MLQDLNTSGSRFAWFITTNYGGVPQYAERFGFNASQVYRVVGETATPRLNTCADYAATGVNIHWLATGEGDWWAPNDVGQELALKQGVLIIDRANPLGIGSLHVPSLVRTLLDRVEKDLIEEISAKLPSKKGKSDSDTRRKSADNP